VRRTRHGYEAACGAYDGRDLLGIGGYYDLTGNAQVRNALPDADYEGCSADEAKRLSREA